VRHPARVRLPLLLGVLLWVLAAAGCVSGAEMDQLESRIKEAGYTEVGVGHSVSTYGHDTVLITAIKPSATDGIEIARLAWHTYAEEVDEVLVTLNGITRSATRDQLLEEFGPRQLDPNPDESTDLGDILGFAVVVVLIIVVLVKVLSFLGRRRRRSGPTLL
jgi:hypothetical protein